jgi:hypothetical protein
MKVINSVATPTTESALHPISMAIRKQAILWSGRSIFVPIAVLGWSTQAEES